MICPHCHQETGIGTASVFNQVLMSRKVCEKCRREFLIVNDVPVAEEQYSRTRKWNDHSIKHPTTEQGVRLDRGTKPLDDVRCPYCVDRDEFRLMRQTFDRYTCPKCSHVVFLDGRICTCMKCRELRAAVIS